MPASSAATNRIHDSLNAALASKRVVFWYDPHGEWASEFEAYQPAAAEKLRVEGNEFSVKARISRAPLEERFLLYLPSAKPPEPDNWLLDLLLAGHEFTADRASLDLQQAGLTLEFKELAHQHKAFFRSPPRITKLKELLRPNDDETAVRLKMLAVLAKQPPDIDKLLLHAFCQLDPANPDGDDPVEALYGTHQLSSHFWRAVGEKFGYANPEPNLRDFAVALFNSVSGIGPSGSLQPHARVFLSIWKDSLRSRPAFERWSDHLAVVLRVEEQLNDAPDSYDPDDDDSYELIERFVLHRLLRRFEVSSAGQNPASELSCLRRSATVAPPAGLKNTSTVTALWSKRSPSAVCSPRPICKCPASRRACSAIAQAGGAWIRPTAAASSMPAPINSPVCSGHCAIGWKPSTSTTCCCRSPTAGVIS